MRSRLPRIGICLEKPACLLLWDCRKETLDASRPRLPLVLCGLGVRLLPHRALGAPSPRCAWWRPRYAQENLARACACASSPEIPRGGHTRDPAYTETEVAGQTSVCLFLFFYWVLAGWSAGKKKTRAGVHGSGRYLVFKAYTPAAPRPAPPLPALLPRPTVRPQRPFLLPMFPLSSSSVAIAISNANSQLLASRGRLKISVSSSLCQPVSPASRGLTSTWLHADVLRVHAA
jgi:hypothetical protein